MTADPVTPAQVGAALEHLGQYAVVRAQKLCTAFPPSILLSLGLRESGLRNICGGAKLVNGAWEPAYTDRGWLQITDTLPDNRAWLAGVPGCPNGSWVPAPGHTAVEPMHCPTFSNAVYHTLTEFAKARVFAVAHGVKAADVTRFCVAAHNAGPTGALEGYKAGNVDLHTTHGDYSQWVLTYAPTIAAWIAARPDWQYRP